MSVLHGRPIVDDPLVRDVLGQRRHLGVKKTKQARKCLEAREQHQVLRLEAHIAGCQLLVVDERGYLPLDKLGAEHLFGFFSQCYERTSLKAKKD